MNCPLPSRRRRRAASLRRFGTVEGLRRSAFPDLNFEIVDLIAEGD